MQRLKNFAISIVILALLVLTSTTSSQNQNHLPESSQQRTSRPEAQEGSRGPQAKFRKVQNAIPNRYIVVLNDDVVRNNDPREARLERVREIANSHALAHFGRVDYLYETALKGYAIELPNEAAAVAISRRPQVQWVEEDERLEPLQAPVSPQFNPPWGLDAIDGNMPAPAPNATGRTNGSYVFNGTGAGVHAYVLDTGINTVHQDFRFPDRAIMAADCIAHNTNCQTGPAAFGEFPCAPGLPSPTNNDCWGHGTHVAGILGGNTYGVAKAVAIRSVKVCARGQGCPNSAITAGVNFVTNTHNASAGIPKVVNMSLGGLKSNPPAQDQLAVNAAVNNSISNGVTYVIAAGNGGVNAATYSPADVQAALTVGAVDWNGNRWIGGPGESSNWGPSVDLWAPGVQVVSAQTGNGLGFPCAVWNGLDNTECMQSGTSMAAPHVAGAVAQYLQGRTALGSNVCGTFPISQSVLNTTANANFSTCPDRVSRYIAATANLNRLASTITVNPNLPSPNRFLWSVWVPTVSNPIDNQRFFVWTHYPDFLNRAEPDDGGLNHWTNNITGPCGTGINDNNACTREWRIHTSRAFWVHQFPALFNAQTGGTTNNLEFVRQVYRTYLRREGDASGVQHWVNDLNQYGNPASYEGVNHIIDAFLVSPEYRRRFGPS